jgi:DNA (cytosine-5)-methyltransferase 1
MLYRHFIRFIDELRPTAYLLENVPGIMNIEGGKVFADIVAALQKLGYSVASALINAATYGVPQLRTRLFVVGARDGRTVQLTDGPLSPQEYVTVGAALADLPADVDGIAPEGPFELPYAAAPSSAYARLMRNGRSIVGNCAPTRHSEPLRARLESLRPGETEKATDHRRLNGQLPAWTLRAGSRTRTACRPIHPTAPRVITIREAARLGSFPDEFWLPDHKAPAHMLIGNSVPPLLTHHLAVCIATQIFGSESV